MNQQEIEQFRTRLLNLKSELAQLEDALEETGKPVELDQTKVGRLSRMDAIQVQQMALEASRRRKNQLLKIEGALRRIELNEYGYCFICGDEMDINRLYADPTNTRCMKCVEN